MNPDLLQLLAEQASREMGAHNSLLALSLWAKSFGYEGSHKWLGRASLEERKHVKGILKLIADYAKADASVPSVFAQSCNAESLPSVYEEVYRLVQDALLGWRAIAAKAEEAQAMEVVAFSDHYLKEFVAMTKRLNRFLRLLQRIEGDQAALLRFDRERK